MAEDAPTARLSVIGLRRRYPGTLAVDLDPGQRLDFLPGEIHALVGENGAGKSTLVSMVAGAVTPSDGTMLLDGKLYSPRDVVDARTSGVDIVLQEPGLVDTMSVEENLLLGREDAYAVHGMFQPATRRRVAREALERIGWHAALGALAATLNLEDQKFVELARALSRTPRVLVIDEMTASLSEAGVPELFRILREFANTGGTVLYISHYLEEVRVLCDRVTVMRDGRHVRTLKASGATEDELSILMVGRSVKDSLFRSDSAARTDGELLLDTTDLTVHGRFDGLDLSVHAGEIVGVGGLVGCGSEILPLVLFGDVRPDRGQIRFRGETVKDAGPGRAISRGIGLVPGDREREGLILGHSLARNITLPSLPWLAHRGVVNHATERRAASSLIERMRIVARGPGDVPLRLSGGNRQKVVLSKWLVRDIAVLLLHNPTRGVDVGGKAEIYGVIRDLAAKGVGVVLVSDDLPELIGMSDTLVMMRRGRVSAVVPRDHRPTEETLIRYML